VAGSRYRIVLRGRLSERFESAFDGMTLEHGPNQTVLIGDVRDQAQLYGLLDRLQEFGIDLVAVDPADTSDDSPEHGAGPLPQIRPATWRTNRRRARPGPPSRCGWRGGLLSRGPSGSEPLLERPQAGYQHAVAHLGGHLVLVRLVAVEPRGPLDVSVIAHGDRTDRDRGCVGADGQSGGVVAERERDSPVLIVELDQGLPVTARERVDPHASDPVRGPALDLGRRQRRVQSPMAAKSRTKAHTSPTGPPTTVLVTICGMSASSWLICSTVLVCGGRGQPRMFTARAMTSAMAATETADWSIIMSFAQRVSDAASLAAKEMASTVRCAVDGLTVLLDGRPAGQRVTLTEIRMRTPRHTSTPRVAEVLAGLGRLEDDSTPAVRSWIERHVGELPDGFASAVRAWLLVLLDGDARARPRSHASIYVYFAAVQPFIGPLGSRPRAPPRGHRQRRQIHA
jgi:hypothetical protein